MNYKKAYTKKNPYFAAIPKFINLYKVMTIQIEETHLRNNFRASHLYREFLSASLPGVDPKILDPRDTYADKAEWDKKAADLASRFVKNFVKCESNEAGKALVKAGPEVDNL